MSDKKTYKAVVLYPRTKTIKAHSLIAAETVAKFNIKMDTDNYEAEPFLLSIEEVKDAK